MGFRMPQQLAQVPQASIFAPSVMDPTMSPHAAGVSAIDDLIKAAPNADMTITVKSKREQKPAGITKTSSKQLSASPTGMTDASALQGGGDAAMQSLIDQLIAQSGNIQPDQQLIQALQGMGTAYADMPARVDLTPLAQLVDQWSGSQFARGYKPPENQQSQQAMQMLQAIVGEQRRAQEGQFESLAKAAGMQLNYEKLKKDTALDVLRIQKAALQGDLKLPEQSVLDKVQKAGDALDILDSVESTVKTNEKVFGPLEGLAALGPNIKGINDLHKSVRTTLEAGVQNVGTRMEGGVLKEGDIKRYRRMMPSIFDSPKVANFKVKFIKGLTKKSLADYIENQIKGKRDMTNFIPQLTALRADSDVQNFKDIDKYVSSEGDFDPQKIETLGQTPQASSTPSFSKGDVIELPEGRFEFQGGDSNDKKNYKKL